MRSQTARYFFLLTGVALVGVFFAVYHSSAIIVGQGCVALQEKARSSRVSTEESRRSDTNATKSDTTSASRRHTDDDPSTDNNTNSTTNDSAKPQSSAGSFIDLDEKTPSADELYDRIAIVTAFSQNHYQEALAFIASIQRTMPEKKIIIYDLGINKDTVPKVKALCNVELRQFPWGSYPKHVKNLMNYAWKPAIIDITLKEFGAIFWGDASARFTKSLRHVMPFSTKHHGFMSHWQGFDPKKEGEIRHQYYYTHPKTYANLGVDREKYYAADDDGAYPAANRQLYVNSSTIQRAIVQPMLACAMELRCIAPEGARYGQHRYDASVLAILIHKNLSKEWTPDNHDGKPFDEMVSLVRNTVGSKDVQTCGK